MSKKIIIVIAVICTLLFSRSMTAQSDRASVTGTVKDSTGAAIAGVQVTATNTSTNATASTVTNELGIYRVLNLPIGPYTVTFSKDSFKTYNRSGLVLGVAEIAEINAVLQVGAATETVTVSDEAPVLQTSTAALTTNLTNSVVTDMPLNVSGGRTLSSFMFAYVPGVEGSDYSSHINGSIAFTKEVMIDGTSAVSQIGGYLSESQPPMEAVQEFQVETAGIRADEGRSGGGVFRYEMKSGTNQFHGSLFGFLHNQAMEANSWWNKHQLVTNLASDPTKASYYHQLYDLPTDNMSQWGGSFGGPVLKDKLFFFGAFERYMYSNFGLGSLSSVVPNSSFLSGDLSSLLDTSVSYGKDGAGNTIYKGAIFDPATGNVFVGNKIPTARFSNVSQKIVSLYQQYYKPQTSNVGNNNSMPANNVPWQHITMGSVKIDYNLSEKDHFNGSFIYSSTPRILADQGGIWSPNATDGGPMANAYNHFVHAPSFRLAESHTFSPTMLNTARFTVNRFYNPSKAVSQSQKWDSQLGLGNFGAGNFPLISFDGSSYNTNYNMSPLGSQFNDFYAANTIIFNDDLSLVTGRHTLKFGAEFRAMQFNKHDDQDVLSVTFNGGQTGDPTATYASNVGHAFASFLLGATNKASVNTPNWLYGRRKALSLYVSDDVKVTDRLTLNLDLRWDYNYPYKEKNGHWSSFDTTRINSVTGTPGALSFLTSGSQSFEKRQYYYNFAPHVGAAYQLDSKTVVRGSFSVFYVPLNMNTWGAVPYGFDPGYVTSSQIQPTGQRISAWENWDNSYSQYATVTGAVKNDNFTKWGMVAIDPRALLPGNTQQWTVGIQRDLGRDFRLDTSFIQSHSYHLQSGLLAGNQPKVADFQALAKNGTTWNWVSNEASAKAAGVPYPYAGFAGSAWMAITPFPSVAASYGPLFYVGTPLGNADYKALQVNITKRASHGLSFMGSYVLSATHGDTDTGFSELWGTGSIQNLYDLGHERNTISSFDQTHVVKGYVSYALPFGHGKALFSGVGRSVDSVINGWTVLGAYHYASGTPLSIHSQNYYPGFNSVYVNQVQGCSLRKNFHQLGDYYFNPSCFKDPNGDVGELGTAGNFLPDLRGLGLATEDIGVNKSFSFGEDRVKVTLRGDAFNAFNRHSYAGPETSIANSNFGKIVSGGGTPGPRLLQVGARIVF